MLQIEKIYEKIRDVNHCNGEEVGFVVMRYKEAIQH